MPLANGGSPDQSFPGRPLAGVQRRDAADRVRAPAGGESAGGAGHPASGRIQIGRDVLRPGVRGGHHGLRRRRRELPGLAGKGAADAYRLSRPGKGGGQRSREAGCVPAGAGRHPREGVGVSRVVS